MNMEKYRPIETAYLYNSYDGDILIYDTKTLRAVFGPTTWCMNDDSTTFAHGDFKIRV